MKNFILSLMSLKEVWFGRFHIYQMGYRKKPYDKFRPVWRMLNIKTGESHEV